MAERECPHMSDCEMYSLFNLSGALEVWKANYCRDKFEACARYERSMCGKSSPINLLPNGQMLRNPPVLMLKNK